MILHIKHLNMTFKNLKEYLEHIGILTPELDQAIEEYYKLKNEEQENVEVTENTMFNFGKFKGKTIKYVVNNEKDHPHYFKWLVEKSSIFENNKNSSLAKVIKKYY